MGQQDFPHGFYANNVPAHRFTEYSKAQLNSAILTNQKDLKQDFVNAMQYAGLNFNHIRKDKKLDVLNPSMN